MDVSSGPFHSGELEVQRRAGLADEARAVGGIVADAVSPAVARFLRDQRLVIAGSLDRAGRPWASVIGGPPGVVQAIEERLVRVATLPAPDDPLRANLRARPELALLVLDPLTRRRLRLNGRGMVVEDALFLRTDEAYGNCPKHIRRRRVTGVNPRQPGRAVRSRALSASQRAFVERADTLFVASFHPARGADVSHRGGPPGFVRVTDVGGLEIPDYRGNAMFNTLGNLMESPGVGLLFVDFARGGTLQATGRARVRFEPERVLAIELDEVRETADGHSLVWEPVEDETTSR